MEKVGLVLVAISGLKQARLRIVCDASVVARRDPVGPEAGCMLEEHTELDMPIAGDWDGLP